MAAAPHGGWLGISVDVLLEQSPRGPVTGRVVISRVMPGSPAEGAGVRPGDVIVVGNGMPPGDFMESLRRSLRPGDPVRLTVQRDGRRIDLDFQAGVRPESAVVSRMTFPVDSIAEIIFHAMDSLRLALITEGSGHGASIVLRAKGDSLAQILGAMPFFTREWADSIRTLSEGLEAGVRMRVLPRMGDRRPLVAIEASPETEAPARPLAPYVMGANRALGAELVEIQPTLAAYFRVDGGVLVVDVPQGTPASAAGLQPGDVITAVDSVAVTSVAGLRLALAHGGPSRSLSVVREGEARRVMIRR